jgi:hypothetical protein
MFKKSKIKGKMLSRMLSLNYKTHCMLSFHFVVLIFHSFFILTNRYFQTVGGTSISIWSAKLAAAIETLENTKRENPNIKTILFSQFTKVLYPFSPFVDLLVPGYAGNSSHEQRIRICSFGWRNEGRRPPLCY